MIIQVRCSGKLHRISYEGGSLRLLDHTGDAYRVLKVEEELQQLRNHPSTCRCAAVLRAWRTRDRKALPAALRAEMPAQRAEKADPDPLRVPLRERIRRQIWHSLERVTRNNLRGPSVAHEIYVSLGAPGVETEIKEDKSRINYPNAYSKKAFSPPKTAQHMFTVPLHWGRVPQSIPIEGFVITLDAWRIPADLIGGHTAYRVVYAGATRGYTLERRVCYYSPDTGRAGKSLGRVLGRSIRRGLQAAIEWYHSTSQLDWRHLDAATALVKRVGCSAELQATIAHAPTAALRKIRLRDVSRSWQQEIEQRDA